MKMGSLEKFLSNNSWSKKRGLTLAKKLLDLVEFDDRTDFLEIGCGTGEVSKHIAKNYIGSVTATDIDPEQIAIARRGSSNIANLTFQEADAIDLPFDDKSFDVVISFGVLHHVDKWQTALTEVKRVLRPGGYFIFAEVIYPETVTNMDKSSSHSFGLASVDVDEVNSFFKKNGFTEIHSLLEKTLVCHNYEAVYRRVQDGQKENLARKTGR
jgi:ubiquinone/menaquinone biosynthesis C-methylase UbiE